MGRATVMLSGVVLWLGGLGAAAAWQGTAAMSVTLDKAGLVAEAKTDSREAMLPPAGQKFLWVKATASAAQTIDLTKVAVTSGAATYTLVGVDSAFDGDPSQFSMIAPFRLKDGGKLTEPYEETRSVGRVSFAYTPSKVATVKINMPPASFCLLFAVPATFKTGQVKGLGASALAVPPLAAGM